MAWSSTFHRLTRTRAAPGVEESLSEAEQAFAPDLRPESGLAGTERHQVSRQVEIIDLVREERVVLPLAAIRVDPRQHQAR